jgi:hypothetical protein
VPHPERLSVGVTRCETVIIYGDDGMGCLSLTDNAKTGIDQGTILQYMHAVLKRVATVSGIFFEF